MTKATPTREREGAQESEVELDLDSEAVFEPVEFELRPGGNRLILRLMRPPYVFSM